MLLELLAGVRVLAEQLMHVFIIEASAALESFLTDATSDELFDDLFGRAMASHEVTKFDLGEHSEVAGLVGIDLFGLSEQGLKLGNLGEEVGGGFLFHA